MGPQGAGGPSEPAVKIDTGALKCSVTWAIFFLFGLGASVTLRGGAIGVHWGR